MLCHQTHSCLWNFIWKTLFALLSDTGLSPIPWATSDFISTVVDSYRQPDKPQGFLQSDGSPWKHGGWIPRDAPKQRGQEGAGPCPSPQRDSAQAHSTRFLYCDCPQRGLLPVIISASQASHSSPPHGCFLHVECLHSHPYSGLLPGNFGHRSGSSPIPGHFLRMLALSCRPFSLDTPSLTIPFPCSVHLPPRISKPPDGYPQPACLQVRQVKKGTHSSLSSSHTPLLGMASQCTQLYTPEPGTLATLLRPLPSTSHPSSAFRASQSLLLLSSPEHIRALTGTPAMTARGII